MIKNRFLKRINKFKRKPTKKKILYFSTLNIFFGITLITSVAFSSFGFLEVASYIKEGGNIADTYLYSAFNTAFIIGAGAMIPAMIGTTKTIKEYKKELKTRPKTEENENNENNVKKNTKETQKKETSTNIPIKEMVSLEEYREYLEKIKQQILDMPIEESYEEEQARIKSKTK